MALAYSLLSDSESQLEQLYDSMPQFNSVIVKNKVKFDVFETCYKTIKYEDAINVIRYGGTIGWKAFDYLLDFTARRYTEIEEFVVSDELMEMERVFVEEEKRAIKAETDQASRKQRYDNWKIKQENFAKSTENGQAGIQENTEKNEDKTVLDDNHLHIDL